MAKREFLRQAQSYKGQRVNNKWVSEKLDGVRALWDGGMTRGMLLGDIPFANTTRAHPNEMAMPVSGLWSRYGKPFYAPAWFLDQLPKVPMDGELWMGRGLFNKTVGIVKSYDGDWSDIKYMVFNMPYVRYWLADGFIDNPNMSVRLRSAYIWAAKLAEAKGVRLFSQSQSFRNVYGILTSQYKENEVFKVHKQVPLGSCHTRGMKILDSFYDEITENDGEGVMLVESESHWMPERSTTLLKKKIFQDAEAVVVGCTFGSETDKGSKLLGSMGALTVSYNGIEFDISGFTEQERLLPAEHVQYAMQHPKEKAPDGIMPLAFAKGQVITFKYMRTNPSGTPRDAQYKRPFNEV